MHRSKNARLRPTALVSISGLLLWAACSSKENDFFTTPPISGAGHSGTSGSAGSSSSGDTASGGAGASATSGSGGSSTSNGGTSGSSGGDSALGGTHATGGAHAMGGTGASGGSDTGGAGEENGGGGVAEGGAPSAGSGGDTSGVGGTSGAGTSGFGGASAAAGAGGASGTSGTGGASGGGGISGAGAASGSGGLGGTSGMGGAGSPNAGAGGSSSPVTCSDDNGCQSSEFCAKTACNAATGTCKTKPLDCAGTDAAFAPVCGCDHMTYYSPCVADREGTNVASQGECTTATVSCTRADGGKSCNPARPLARCYRPRTSCSGTSPATGVCWVMPDECPNEPQVNRYCGGTSGTQSCVGLCEGLFNEYPVWRDSSLCQ